ncbi:MAG: serine hydrolase domain-containing protein [Bryobacteraceae bacterium]
MHDVLEGFVDRAEVPGMVGLVSKGGDVHVETVGYTSLDRTQTMKRDTIFRIASMSKPVVSVAAMILVEECKLRLDDPVDEHLPELANRRVLKQMDGSLDQTVPANRPITLRDLLTFRWGFGMVMAPPGSYPIYEAAIKNGIRVGIPRPQEQPGPDEWMRGMGALPLMHQPGERWMYDTGSDVLGVLVGRVAGQTLGTFLRERIFNPLGMRDTAFFVPQEKTSRFTTSYWGGAGKLEVFDESEGGQWNRQPAFESGAGGLVSTVDDYLAFSQLLLDKGKCKGGRILSRASVELMTADHLTSAQKIVSGLTPGDFDNRGWGFGVSVVTQRDDVASSVGQFGWNGGLGTSWFADPNEGLTGLLLTQRAWTSPVPPKASLDFATTAYSAIDD